MYPEDFFNKNILRLAEDLTKNVTSGTVLNILANGAGYTHWEWHFVDGWKLEWKFIKRIPKDKAKDFEFEHDGLYILTGLTSDWHSQAQVTVKIQSARKEIQANRLRGEAKMPVGKYAGMTFEQIMKRKPEYLKWWAFLQPHEIDFYNEKPELIEWIQKQVIETLKAHDYEFFAGHWFNRNDTDDMTRISYYIKDCIRDHKPIRLAINKTNRYNYSGGWKIEGEFDYRKTRKSQCKWLVITEYHATGDTIFVMDYGIYSD